MAEPGTDGERLGRWHGSASARLWPIALAVAAGLWVARLAVQLNLTRRPVLDSDGRWLDVAIPLLVGAVMLWAAWRLRSTGAGPAGAWWLLAAAYLTYAAGELPSAVFGVGLNRGPVAYANTAAYVIFYVLFLSAVLRLPAVPLARQERFKLLLDTGIVVAAAGLVQWTLVLAPVVHRPGVDPFRVLLTIVFPVGDLLLLWALLELLLRRHEPGTRGIYGLLAGAAAFLIVTDVVWGRQILLLDQAYNWVLGPGWAASHLLAGLAAVRAVVQPHRPAPAAAARGLAPAPRGSLYLADGCVGLAVAVLVLHHLRDVTAVSALLVVCVGLLVATRHLLGLRESAELHRQLQAAHDDLEQKVMSRTAELNAANAELLAEVAERRRAERELQRRLRELTLLSAVAEIAVEVADEEDRLARTTLAVRGALLTDSCGFLLMDEARQALEYTPSFVADGDRDLVQRVPLSEGLIGSAAASGAVRRATGAADGAGDASPVRSEICVPLRVADRVIGVIDVQGRGKDGFSDDDERVLTTVASQVATAMERLRWAAALRQSEQNYREVFNATSEGIFVHDAETGAVLDVNQTTLDLYGYTREEALSLNLAELSAQRPPFTQREAEARIRSAIEEGPQVFEWCARRKTGEEFWTEIALRSSLIGGKGRVLAVVRDISERKRAEEALHLSEERFRSMVQQSYDFITVLDAGGTITYATPAAGLALGYGAKGLIGRNGLELIHPDDLQAVREAFDRTAGGAATGRPIEFRIRHANGTWVALEALGSNQLTHPSIRGILLNVREVGERKRAEEEIRRKLEELTVLNAVAELAVGAEDEGVLIVRTTEIVRGALFPDDCGVLLVDEEAGVLRYTPSYRQEVTPINREPIPLGTGITGVVAANGVSRREDDVTRAPEYVARLAGMHSEICVPIKVGQRVIGVINAESGRPAAFTAHDEAVLETVAGQLATAIGRLRAAAAQRESEERFRRLTEAAFEGIGITDQGRIVDANARLAEMLGYSVPELLGRNVMEFVAPASVERVETFLRQGKSEMYEHLAVRKDGSVFPVETQGKVLPGGGTIRVAAVRDITERKRAEQRIQGQLERLAALRAIDAAITGGLDLPEMLDLFLAHLVAQLSVDAADVLLLGSGDDALVFAAGRGFRSEAVRETRLALGQCYAGRAAFEQRMITVPDLAEAPDGPARAPLLAGEAFKIYFGAPLVAKGHVHGVLEVFGRRPFEPDREWLDYLETLAGQLAIAIENRTLFESLQRSNAELALAYDTTLEGWSKALELRDRETHGHTARVVDLTVRLATAMGVAARDLVHVRRGALLHDIGKMAIPDGILLKPAELTEEEWGVMRQHPQFAFDLLSPISFLRPALAIPYSHHEHWDGSGYPRGLAGDAIPLVARIFAVVDAWDALRSDRPYRRAWTDAQVRAYLNQEAGHRFDPGVVETFLPMARLTG